VRKSANRVRITGQLIDAASGAHLWADRLDGAAEDVFDLQDQVTASVVNAIAPKVEQAEIKRVMRKPTDSLIAYDYFLREWRRRIKTLRTRSTQRCDYSPRQSSWTRVLQQHTAWRRFAMCCESRAAG